MAPVHATAQADELGIGTVLVPKLAPAFSALGLQLSDHIVDEMRAYIAPIDAASSSSASTALFAEMESRRESGAGQAPRHAQACRDCGAS